MADRSMPSSFDDDKEYNETGFQKVSRKLREEPLIPLGTALTCLALYNAWKGMRRGDHAQVQRMFRARIGAQAFTVMAIVAGGAYYGADRDKRKELIKLEAQQRAEERHQKWLRELEVRDDEEKQLKAALRRRRDRVEQRKVEDMDRDTDAAAAADPGDALKAEVTADAEGQVPPAGKKEGSSVLGALSNSGGWFGTKKNEGQKPAEEQTTDAESRKK